MNRNSFGLILWLLILTLASAEVSASANADATDKTEISASADADATDKTEISASANSDKKDKVDELVLAKMAEHHIPGAAVAVIDHGKVVKMKGYGVASLEFRVPVTTETVFEIGSVSKQLTAAGIMLLVEEGKVGLDDPISKFIKNTPPAWSGVTIRHLLTHSSGVKSYTSLDGFGLILRQTVDDFVKKLGPYPLEFAPGERNIYSNSGYTLLGYVIESVSGKKYIDFMRERIFTPLGMTKTADRDPQFIIPNRATGYEWSDDRYTGRSWDLTDLMGAGTIVAPIEDLVKWDLALRGDKFLSPESRKSIWTQFTFNNGTLSPYGFGWRISTLRGHKLIGHTGQTAGFGSANFRYVDDDIAVIALTNLGENGMGSMIAAGVAKLYIPSMSLRAMKMVSETDKAKLTAVSNAVRNRVDNKPSADKLTPELLRAVSTERAKAENKRIASFGPLKTITTGGIETVDNRKIYRYRIDTGRRLFLWRVSFDAAGKLSEMTLEEEE